VLLLPTGGVSVSDIPGYLRAGAIAVGMGSPLVGRALHDASELAGLKERATAALAAVALGRVAE
jgi:2-dehydro-3-deoxyphosphogluconate aldolase/(4S)-4-hydroxy-2-oxoglutarate aldolase